MKNYWRVMIGEKGSLVKYSLDHEIFGINYGFFEDLSSFPDSLDQFKDFSRDKIKKVFPEKTKVSVGLMSGQFWSFSKVMKEGDIILASDSRDYRNEGIVYRIGIVDGPYQYDKDAEYFLHQRKVNWTGETINRRDMTRELQNSLGATHTTVRLTEEGVGEVEAHLAGSLAFQNQILEGVEDEFAFDMEAHLEDFLVKNWVSTPLAKDWDIYEEDGDLLGKQYPTDTGPLDILAISKDKKTYLVIELKRGRASDRVVGQVMRYMGYVREEMAEEGQEVRGLIIALEDDVSLRRSISIVDSIDFMRYKVSFDLV